MTASKDNEMAKSKVPILNTELRIILGGIASGTARSVFECPFEYAKVRRQTNQSWQMKEVFKGLPENYFKCTLMLTSFFIMFTKTKERTNLMDSKLGQFIITGTCSSLAWIVCWPFEMLKNLS